MTVLQSAIATDIARAERLLSDRRTAGGEWCYDTDPVLCDLVGDLCDALRSASAGLAEVTRLRAVEAGYQGAVRELSALVLLREEERDEARALARTLLACARSGDPIPGDLPGWVEADDD